ncbi:MAG: RNase adapter RapZ [Clostridiales bacterium]|nr:RNase adapter RapZ [Clostridiales bacterium]
MRFVIVTGMSGAGKSSVLKMLEDSGYFCVDNLPIPFLMKFARLALKENSTITKVALGIDIRSGQALEELGTVLEEAKRAGYHYEILFLEAGTEVLVKRYKETRRVHPLSGNGRVDSGIELERKKLKFLKDRADYIIDTSRLLIRELKVEVDNIFVKDGSSHSFFITVLSFGFKYGIPSDVDLVFDVRFLENPYYVPALKEKTGNDEEVKKFVLALPQASVFLDKVTDLLMFLIPNYITEGKTQLVIGIGCTGGRHRSVTLANELTGRLRTSEYSVKAEHRDIEKG